MIDVLTEKSLRVLLESDKPITSSKIAREIGMSESSIKHNIEYLKQVVRNCGGQLKSLPGKGLWLELDAKQKEDLNSLISENRDKSFYYSYRKSYILSVLFQYNSNYTIQIFADDLGVGKNIIIRDLETIGKWLNYFGLDLVKTRSKGIQAVGSEFDKRQAIIYNNNSRIDEVVIQKDKPDDIDYRISQSFYSYFKQFYPQYTIFELQQYIREIESEIDFVYDDVSFCQLIEYIAITITRINEKNIIHEASIINKCKVTPKQLNIASELINAITRGKQSQLVNESKCMATQFVLYGAYASGNSIIKESYYNEIARDFVERLQRIILNKNILVSETLIEDFSNFFYKKKMQKSYQIINNSYFRKDIKKRLPSLYGIIMTTIQPIEHMVNLKFTENDIAYFVMLIDNAIEDDTDMVKILFITAFDYNTIKYHENKIKKSLKHIDKVKSIRTTDVDQFPNIDKYELVLTTVPCTISRAIKISRRVDNVDLELIRKNIEIIINKKREFIFSDYHLFKENLIKLKVNCKKKEEVMIAGCKFLEDMGYVEKEFLDDIIQRESIATTAIDWSKDDRVDVVFIIAIDFDNKNEIYNFFSKFYELIDDKQQINKIRQATAAKEVLDIIYETGTVKRI